jgi:hypothetical protein
MPMHTAHSPRGAAVPGAAVESRTPGGGPNPMPIAANRKAGLAAGATDHAIPLSVAPSIPHAHLSSLGKSGIARGTSLPAGSFGAAGGAFSSR